MALDDFRQGNTVSFEIFFQSELEDGTTSHTDITGFVFTLTLKKSFDETDAEAALQHSHTAGQGIKDDATRGYCVFTVPSSKTNIASGSYYYDLQVIEPSGAKTTIDPPDNEYRQKITVIPQVTQKAVSP